ncbi:DUF7684 family protein [Undibacterium sp. Di27W]|uniref:DUF7684 family protein n=1 Tax=Undibacterium sp. Di27W TaxID=3413036 RepID=UPI003BF21DFE
MTNNIVYLHLKPDTVPDDISALAPYLAIVVIDAEVTSEWRWEISKWLVHSGCLYMIAWGPECSLWDDAVDWAHMEKFDFGDYPEEDFLPTCWFADYALEEVFEFAKVHVEHPTVELRHTVLLHISAHSNDGAILRAYAEA